MVIPLVKPYAHPEPNPLVIPQNIYKYVLILAIYQYIFNRGYTMDTKNITLKVNSELYNQYREYCKKKGLIASRQFEILMEEKLAEVQNEY